MTPDAPPTTEAKKYARRTLDQILAEETDPARERALVTALIVLDIDLGVYEVWAQNIEKLKRM